MIPKKMAINLVDKYFDLNLDWDGVTKYEWAKEGALIAVSHIIYSNPHSNPFNTEVYSTMSYWLQVKEEIELL